MLLCHLQAFITKYKLHMKIQYPAIEPKEENTATLPASVIFFNLKNR